jgi:hypothetical protein
MWVWMVADGKVKSFMGSFLTLFKFNSVLMLRKVKSWLDATEKTLCF